MRIEFILKLMALCAVLAGTVVHANGICLLQDSVTSKVSTESAGACSTDPCPALPDDHSQSPSTNSGPAEKKDSDEQSPLSIKRVLFNLPGDQKAIWTSPFHISKQDS